MPIAIANYTTKIDAGRTCAEISARLGKAGARAVSIDYADGEPVAVSFMLAVPHGVDTIPMTFRLPSRWEGVLKAITRSTAPKALRTEAQTGQTLAEMFAAEGLPKMLTPPTA